ncbi:C-C motif chemokine 19-like isoform X1 [Aquarana catesbeiana]|uniref:C-C motif chemokine 19-like isoform X1 n=1 Tax=Aquarana catesbeiana TaxID=8400 RepID=UPI003CC9856F
MQEIHVLWRDHYKQLIDHRAYFLAVSAASRNPSGCCLATNDKKIPYKIISTYKHQGLFSGCDIPAIVFTTNKNKHLCAPTDSDWVKKYMVCLDQKLKIC